MRWVREDLQEDLLDLKDAWIAGNAYELPDRVEDVLRQLAALAKTLRGLDEHS